MTSVPQEILSGRNSADRSLQADFGVVLSRVIHSIENDPAQLRHAVYEPARMKLRRELPTKSANRTIWQVRRSKARARVRDRRRGGYVLETRYELRALQSLNRFIESSEVGQSEVMIEPRAPLLNINQEDELRVRILIIRLVFLARVKSPSPNLKRLIAMARCRVAAARSNGRHYCRGVVR